MGDGDVNLLFLVGFPFIMAPVIYFAGVVYGRKVGYLVGLAILSGLLTLALYYPTVMTKGAVVEPHFWTNVLGQDVNFNLMLDGLSLVYAFSIAAVSAAVAFYSMPYMAHRFHEMGIRGPEEINRSFAQFYLLYIFFYLGMIGVVLSTNVVQFYLFYEMILIPTWLLIHLFGYGDRERIALTYFIWTHISGLLVLLGFIIHYLDTGSIEISSYTILTQAMPFLLFGFGIKLAIFGLHLWLPLAHAEAPTPISALLSPVTIGIGAYGILRFTYPLLPYIAPFIVGWAFITILYGGLVALSEDDIKRLLAYSSVSHMGYMLLGIASVTWLGTAGVAYHYATHAFLKGVLFMTAGVLITQLHGNRRISLMGGLGAKMPFPALFMASGFLGLAGLPPFSGFNSKLLIFSGAFLGAQDYIYTGIVVAALLSTCLTLGYGALTFKRTMLGEMKEGVEVEKAEPIMLASTGFLLILAVLFFFFPSLVLVPLMR